MSQALQRILLALGIAALLGLITAMILSVAATIPGSTPARVVLVTAGPYPLTVRLYKDQALAGFALPFTIAPLPPTKKPLHFDATSVPARGIDATPVHSSLSPDPSTGGVQGAAEMTVRGSWYLRVTVSGSAGKGIVDVPVTVVAPPAIPGWLAWPVGLTPLYGLLVFLLLQPSRKKTPGQLAA
jgi:hypothetical protein